MQFVDRLGAEHRALQSRLDALETLVESGAKDQALHTVAASLQLVFERHSHEEEVLWRLDPFDAGQARTMAELQTDHERFAFLFGAITQAKGQHLRVLCRTLVGLKRYHVGAETELLTSLGGHLPAALLAQQPARSGRGAALAG